MDRILEEADRALQTLFAGLQGQDLETAIRNAFDSADPLGGKLDRSLAIPYRSPIVCLPRGLLPYFPNTNTVLRLASASASLGCAFRSRFGKALSAMGVRLSSDEMTKLFDEFDTTAKNTIEFSEFKGMVDECLAGNDVESESSRSTTSGSSLSLFSSDSMALQKHPLILQVLLRPYPACSSMLLFHSAGPGAVPPAYLAFVMNICTVDCNHSKHGIACSRCKPRKAKSVGSHLRRAFSRTWC
jgi:hypothetical protein